MMAEEAEQNGSRGFPGLSLGDWGRGGWGGGRYGGNHRVYTCPHLAQTPPCRLISAIIVLGALSQSLSPLPQRLRGGDEGGGSKAG